MIQKMIKVVEELKRQVTTNELFEEWRWMG